MSEIEVNPPKSPVRPAQLTDASVIQFRCHPEVACFNRCCQQIDITLTPYDLLRLKHRLELTSQQLLAAYTVPFEMDGDGLPGVKLRTEDDSPCCLFLTDGGCGIYADRPTACRYYPVGMLSTRKAGEAVDGQSYALVREEHCLGHREPREISVADYRREQEVEKYDDLARGWRQLILKKKSTGPKVGTHTRRSLQLFFLASYNLDGFRDFVLSDGFRNAHDLDEATWASLREDDEALLVFGYRLLRQVLFGEQTIPLRSRSEVDAGGE
jgi:Fe-S-cluster containining protein